MLLWIESQPTALIALVVFTLVYLAGAAIFLVSSAISRVPIASHVQPISPALLSPLGTILGILIVFLAARVWTSLDRAHEYVSHEISALREAALLIKSLPPGVERSVRDALREHIDFIVSDDWPAMQKRRDSLRVRALHLEAAMRNLLSFSPDSTNEKLAQQRALAAIEDAFENRRYRIALSRTQIDPIQWIVVLILSGTVLMTIAAVHIRHDVATAIALLSFSSAVAMCLVLLLEYDRPFATGGFSITAEDYRDVLPD